jgi:hypothetical protein
MSPIRWDDPCKSALSRSSMGDCAIFTVIVLEVKSISIIFQRIRV